MLKMRSKEEKEEEGERNLRMEKNVGEVKLVAEEPPANKHSCAKLPRRNFGERFFLEGKKVSARL